MRGELLKLIVYGGHQMPGAQIKIGGVMHELKDFARQQKDGKKFAQQY